MINRTMEQIKTQARKVREPDGVSITQIVVDFIQERFYAIRDKVGIVRCKISTCDNTTTNMLLTSTPNYVQRIACDPWNGFIYYSTNVGDVFSMHLFPIDCPSKFFLRPLLDVYLIFQLLILFKSMLVTRNCL
uniref:Uncharacterized protein n=1 Tax=Meloidogyne enterolobii TaxID=390850 RepID=A0A6V7Y5D1_MELEN|nr:unnamed protein product [Meloidogyne enterolobii]